MTKPDARGVLHLSPEWSAAEFWVIELIGASALKERQPRLPSQTIEYANTAFFVELPAWL